MRRYAALLLIVLTAVLAAGVAAAAKDPTAEDVLERTGAAWQGDSFHATVRLETTIAGATKHHTLEIWTLGEALALIRVLEPEADRNSGYLQLDDDLWYYAPAVGAIKLPSMALADALFGAGPSLEDLSHGTLSGDFDASLAPAEVGGGVGWFLTLVPHADVPVVYGRLELSVSADYVIETLVYYDQRGEVLQTATFSDVIDIDGRRFPTTVVIEDAFGGRTVERIEEPTFDAAIDPSFFSLETFERWGEPQ